MPNEKTKTKVTTYKRGKHKGEVKKIKTYTTDASGYITKQKVKMKGGEITKSKIKKSKRGILGILGAKTKAKYTKTSGVTVSQVKGKVDPTKVVKEGIVTMRTSIRGKVTKGNVVRSEWGKMGA